MKKYVSGYELSGATCPVSSSMFVFGFAWSRQRGEAAIRKSDKLYLGHKNVGPYDLLRALLEGKDTDQRSYIDAVLLTKECLSKAHPTEVRLERLGMFVNAAATAENRKQYNVKSMNYQDVDNNVVDVAIDIPGAGLNAMTVLPPVTDHEGLLESRKQRGTVVKTIVPGRPLYVVEFGPALEYLPFASLER